MRVMKDSGIAWIGKVPDAWDVKPIRAVFEEVTEKNKRGEVKNALKFTYGSIVRKTDFDAEDDEYVADTILNYTIVEPGTIMLNGLNLNFDLISQRIGLVKERGIITSAYMAFRVKDNSCMLPEYATYLFKSYDGCMALHNMGGGVRKILNFQEFQRYYVFIPPLHEQKDIALYLDRKCSEIDALTADIEKQIETLEQYKRSVITEAVTKGLEPDAEMKDSGVEWIGEIPLSWKAIKIKHLANIRNESRAFDPETDNYIGMENVQSYCDNLTSTDSQYEASIQKVCYVGDVMFGKLRPYLAKVIIAPFNGFCTGEFLQLSHFKGDKRFLRYFMLSDGFIEHINASTYGTKMPRASTEFIINSIMTFPAMAEQKYICDYLDNKCTKIDDAINEKRTQLDTLSEYKKSLIYEYVTGKKEAPSA